MIIHIYSIMRNEETLLPYFLRHYSTFADKIFIINDHSTDNTAKIAKKNSKVVLLKYPYKGFNDKDHIRCFTECYKRFSRNKADWVACVDGDEFIYNRDIIPNLEKCAAEGIKIVNTTGFAMISKKIPTTRKQIYEECFLGIRERRYDKPCIFKPEIDIVFKDGRHGILSKNLLQPVKAKIMLLHYRYLSREYYQKRSESELARMDISNELRKYLIRGGLKFYDNVVNTDLKRII